MVYILDKDGNETDIEYTEECLFHTLKKIKTVQ